MTDAERSALRFLASGNPWKLLATVAAVLCGLNAVAQLSMHAIYGAEQLGPGTMSRLEGAAIGGILTATLLGVAWFLPSIRDRSARADLSAGQAEVVELHVQQLTELFHEDDQNPSHVAADVGKGWLLVMEHGFWLGDVASSKTGRAWPKGSQVVEGMTLVRAPQSGYIIGVYCSGKRSSHLGRACVTAPLDLLPQCIFLQATIETLPAAVDRWIETLPKRRKVASAE
jgi:hypothetical protein